MAGFTAAILGPVLTVAAARVVSGCSARAVAARTAATVSAYLSFVAPALRGGSDYDLSRLLVNARGLESLLEATPEVEVYHGTAPLVHGGARPLTTAELAQLRHDRATEWWGRAALAPFYDRDGWSIVGAVRIPPPALGPAWVEWTVLGLLLVALALVGIAALAIRRGDPIQRRLVRWFAGVAVCLGVAAYVEVRCAAREATDRWLVDAAALVQQAATRGPGRKGLAWAAPLVRGAELVPGDRGGQTPVRRRLGGQQMGVVAVRLGGGRWAELRTRAAESDTWSWLVWLVALALVGPAGAFTLARPAKGG